VKTNGLRQARTQACDQTWRRLSASSEIPMTEHDDGEDAYVSVFRVLGQVPQ